MSATNRPAPYEPAAASSHARTTSSDRHKPQGALVTDVAPGSPAQREGLEAGMVVTHVNGCALRDMVDWDWEADGPYVYLEGIAYQGTPDEFEFECEMERELGEDWGVSFDGAVFDGMRLCRNDCTFCFMKMLPKGMRRTLYMRDDDYRLSFLQGNFVTLTNVTDADVERIVERALSPLNVSLHAVTPSVRARLMGKNAQRGLDVLEQLLAAGIEVHAQVVLVPGANDGDELERTLSFVEERPGITSLGIVPLGYTRFQDEFTSSYSDDPAAARAVVEQLTPYQQRSRQRTGTTRFQLADEFYLAAGLEVPPSEAYDGYPQYHDGIGMVRSFVDEACDLLHDPTAAADLAKAAARRSDHGERLLFVTGEAALPVVERFVRESPLAPCASVTAVHNDYFGGNVDVAGLLVACDVLAQLPEDLAHTIVVLPDAMFNADRLTLDGTSEQDLAAAVAQRGGRLAVTPCTPHGIAMCMGEL